MRQSGCSVYLYTPLFARSTGEYVSMSSHRTSCVIHGAPPFSEAVTVQRP